MKAYIVIFGMMLFACQPNGEQNSAHLRDKYLHLDSIYSQDVFDDSVCQIAIDSAHRRFEKGKFELFAFISSDSSHTPIHVLQNRFRLRVIGFANEAYVFKFCFNEGMIDEFERKHGFNPIDSVKAVYDSLFTIGLTNIQPRFRDGDEGFKRYMICSLEFPDGMEIKPPYPVVEISFRISPSGEPDKVVITKSHSAKYDSAVLKVIRMMPKWTPARGDNGKYEEQSIQWRFRFDPTERASYCR